MTFPWMFVLCCIQFCRIHSAISIKLLLSLPISDCCLMKSLTGIFQAFQFYLIFIDLQQFHFTFHYKQTYFVIFNKPSLLLDTLFALYVAYFITNSSVSRKFIINRQKTVCNSQYSSININAYRIFLIFLQIAHCLSTINIWVHMTLIDFDKTTIDR